MFDWNRSGKHEFIGSFETTLDALEHQNQRRFTLINPEIKAKKRNYVGSGSIVVEEFKVCRVIFRKGEREWCRKRFSRNTCSSQLTKVHTFLDYIRGGCEINLITAIDFTASNGNPMHSNSLHYNGVQSRPNEYLQALQSIGEILTPYDADQNFPVFGCECLTLFCLDSCGFRFWIAIDVC